MHSPKGNTFNCVIDVDLLTKL